MKLLYVIPRPRYRPYSGRDLRIESQLVALGSFAEVKLVELGGGEFEESDSDNVEFAKINKPTSTQMAEILNKTKPPFFYNVTISNLKKIATEIKDFSPDILIFSGIESAAIRIQLREVTSIPFIIDLDETVHRWSTSLQKINVEKTLKLAWKLYFPILRDYEDKLLANFDQVWVSSEIEKSVLERLHKKAISIKVIPNALFFEGNQRPIQKHPDTGNQTLIFVGTFSHLPNVFAVDEIVHKIAPKLDNFTIEIIGREMPEKWLTGPQTQNIKYYRDVDDLKPFYDRALACLIPIRTGAGTRYKALEAMAYGVPIISSEFGVEGLGLIDSRHYLRAETQEDYLLQVKRLINEEELGESLTQNSRKHFDLYFSNTALKLKLQEALKV